MPAGRGDYRYTRPAFKSPPKAAPARRPTPAPQSQPAPTPVFRGGGGNTNFGPTLSAPLPAAPAAPAPAAPPPTPNPNAYLADKSYIAQVAALRAAMQNYNTDYTNKTTQYNTQFGDALRNLGWQTASKGAVDDPSTPNINEAKGAWNFNDQNTAAGKGFQSQKNDFAARGLMQSSLYAQALNDLVRSLSDQNTSLNNAKTSYLSGLSSDKAQFGAQNTYQREQAKQDAIQRVNASFYNQLLQAG